MKTTLRKTIYKYPFNIDDSFTIEMPLGAEVLSVGLDPLGQQCVWALVDTSAESIPFRFALRGTGHPAEGLKASDFVGTFLMGRLVFHVFQVRP